MSSETISLHPHHSSSRMTVFSTYTPRLQEALEGKTNFQYRVELVLEQTPLGHLRICLLSTAVAAQFLLRNRQAYVAITLLQESRYYCRNEQPLNSGKSGPW